MTPEDARHHSRALEIALQRTVATRDEIFPPGQGLEIERGPANQAAFILQMMSVGYLTLARELEDA